MSVAPAPRRLHRILVVCAAVWCLAPGVPAVAGDRERQGVELNNRGVNEAKAGRFEAGVGLLREALTIDPHDEQVRANLTGILTDWAERLAKQGHLEEAERHFHEAIQYDPANGRALILLGDLYYFQRSQFDQAIAWWKRAHGNVPTNVWQGVARRISQAERDHTIERTFDVSKTLHFDVRVDDPRHPAVTTLGQLLEEEYARLHEMLGRGPSRITVIVYTAQDLQRLYNQRDWAIGFYDGRLRLRWNELVAGDVRPLVAHELAHAFLHHGFGAYLPVWIHEGFAQFSEGARLQSREEQTIEEGIKDRTLWIPLAWIDRRFSQPSGEQDIQRAYVESRLVVEELVRRYGMDRFETFLVQCAKGVPVETAFDKVFSPARWVRANQGVFD